MAAISKLPWKVVCNEEKGVVEIRSDDEGDGCVIVGILYSHDKRNGRFISEEDIVNAELICKAVNNFREG